MQVTLKICVCFRLVANEYFWNFDTSFFSCTKKNHSLLAVLHIQARLHIHTHDNRNVRKGVDNHWVWEEGRVKWWEGGEKKWSREEMGTKIEKDLWKYAVGLAFFLQNIVARVSWCYMQTRVRLTALHQTNVIHRPGQASEREINTRGRTISRDDFAHNLEGVRGVQTEEVRFGKVDFGGDGFDCQMKLHWLPSRAYFCTPCWSCCCRGFWGKQ